MDRQSREPRHRGSSWVSTRSAHAEGHSVDAVRVRRRRPRRGRRPRHGPQHCVRNPGGPASGLASDRQVRTGHLRGTTVMDGGGEGSRTASEYRGSLRTRVAPRDRRSRWREGSGPRGTWRSTPGAGHRAGVSCPRRSAAYGRHLRVPARQTRGRSPVRECRTPGAVRGCRVIGIPTATIQKNRVCNEKIKRL
jgi:hypothetical protein